MGILDTLGTLGAWKLMRVVGCLQAEAQAGRRCAPRGYFASRSGGRGF